MIPLIAWKNIWRNKVRSLVVLLAIASGLFGGVFSSAVMKGMADERIREAISREVAHLQVHHPAFRDNYDMNYTVPDLALLEKKASSLPQVACWASRIRFTAMAATASSSTGVMVFGVDPAQEKKISDLWTTIADSNGTYLSEGKANQVVVGEKLAKKLRLKLRSKLVLTFQDKDGVLNGAAFRVCGIYKTNNSMFDEANVFLRAADIGPILGFAHGQAQEFCVRLNKDDEAGEVKAELQKVSSAALVQTWNEVDPMLGMLNEFMDLMLYIFLGIILLALGFGIVNTMLMVVLERTRELGMLSCIGMTKGRLFRMIMMESVYLCIIGGLAGMGIAHLTNVWFGIHGIDMSDFAEGLRGVGYSPIIYPHLELRYYVGIGLMVFATGVLASVYPGRKALKMNPAEAIRAD